MRYTATAYGLRTGDFVDSLCIYAGDDDSAIVRARDWADTLGEGYRVQLDAVGGVPVTDINT